MSGGPAGPTATLNPRLVPLVLVTGLTLLALDAVGFGPIGGLRRAVWWAGRPVAAVLSTAASPVAAAWNGAVHYDSVVEENQHLRERLAQAEGRLAAAPDLEAELAALTEAVDVDYLGDVERLTARVVVDRHTGLERVIELGKGRDQGVRPGMPVVTGSGLVGVVHEVIGDRSIVRLVVDPEVVVGVRTGHGLGLVSGNPGRGLELEPAPELAAAIESGEVAVGHRLLTSGLERSRFPAGIPVGTLGQDRFGRPTVVPLADLDKLGYVAVLLVEQPA